MQQKFKIIVYYIQMGIFIDKFIDKKSRNERGCEDGNEFYL